MPCVVTPNLFAPSFSRPCSTGVCRYKIFLITTNNCLSAWQLCPDRISCKSLAIFCHNKKLFGCDRFFFSGSCRLLSCLSRHWTQLPWPFSSLLQFLSQPTFLYRDRILSFLSFYCRDRKLLCRERKLLCHDRSFSFNS